MAGIMDVVMLVIVLGGAYFVLKSGVLNTLGQPAPVTGTTPTDTTTTPTDGTTTTTTPTDGTTTTTPTTTTPTSTGNPLQDLIDQLLGGTGTGPTQGGINTIPTGTIPPQQYPVVPQQPIYPAGNPAECQSRYNGKCNTECSSGNQSLCNACQIACGGAAVGAVQTLPGQGGANPSLCSSKYNGKCNTECSSGSSSECTNCKIACGSYGAYAYYVKTPQSLITSTVFGDRHHSYYSSWGNVGITNAR